MTRVYIVNSATSHDDVSGLWLELPATDEEIEEVMQELGITEDEYVITRYECEMANIIFSDISGWDKFSYIEEFDEANEELEGLADEELEIVEVLLDKGGYNFDDAICAVGECLILHDVTSMEEVARDTVFEMGILDSVPDRYRSYFDYEAFGRDLDIEGEYYFANGNCYSMC